MAQDAFPFREPGPPLCRLRRPRCVVVQVDVSGREVRYSPAVLVRLRSRFAVLERGQLFADLPHVRLRVERTVHVLAPGFVIPIVPRFEIERNVRDVF